MEFNVAALEKLIEISEEHTRKINKLIQIVAALNTKVLALETTAKNSLTKETVSALTSVVSDIKNKVDIIELDSGAQHHLDQHNQEVVQDWRGEHNVGFNSDMIPMMDMDIRMHQTRRR